MRCLSIIRWAALLAIVSTDVALQAAEPNATLIAHWPLRGDASDQTGNPHHGRLHNVNLEAAGPDGQPRGAAGFDGRKSWIEIPHAASLALADRPFSLALWTYTDESLEDNLGELISKFDLERRRGLNLGFLTNVAATSSQANYRQLYFGIDNHQIEASWSDCGRPGGAVLIFALAAFNGRLYAGTCEPAADQAGRVYRFDGGAQWVDCGSPDGANSVSALAVHDGALYAATACYRLRGSALPDSGNQQPGGHVYRYEADGKWTDCGKLGAAEAINALVVYRGKLYGTSTYSPGVFRYDGDQRWTDCGTPNGRRVEALTVFEGALYGTGYDAGEIYRYRPEDGWQIVGALPETTQTYGFAVYGGRLFVGTWPTGSVYRYEAPGEWTSCGRLGEEREVMAIATYNGGMYAGTLPLAEVYRYAGERAWTSVGRLDRTPDVTYRRVWSMAVFQGRLFAGTLPSGHVWSIGAGRCATLDRTLPAGWHHVAAVRGAKSLALYVDGQKVAQSAEFDSREFDLSNEQPLRIGAGTHGNFCGRVRDVRLYSGELTAEDTAALAAAR